MLGAVEGLSYLAVLGFAGAGVAARGSSGGKQGLPGALAVPEMMAYGALAAGLLVLASQVWLAWRTVVVLLNSVFALLICLHLLIWLACCGGVVCRWCKHIAYLLPRAVDPRHVRLLQYKSALSCIYFYRCSRTLGVTKLSTFRMRISAHHQLLSADQSTHVRGG